MIFFLFCRPHHPSIAGNLHGHPISVELGGPPSGGHPGPAPKRGVPGGPPVSVSLAATGGLGGRSVSPAVAAANLAMVQRQPYPGSYAGLTLPTQPPRGQQQQQQQSADQLRYIQQQYHNAAAAAGVYVRNPVRQRNGFDFIF